MELECDSVQLSQGPRGEDIPAITSPVVSTSIVATLEVSFAGVWPSCDVDGKRLTDDKSLRRAGTPMSDKWACTEHRGDWKLGLIAGNIWQQMIIKGPSLFHRFKDKKY